MGTQHHHPKETGMKRPAKAWFMSPRKHCALLLLATLVSFTSPAGADLLGSGCEGHVYVYRLPDEPNLDLCIKVPKNPANFDDVMRGCKANAAIGGPAVYGTGMYDGKPGVIMQRLCLEGAQRFPSVDFPQEGMAAVWQSMCDVANTGFKPDDFQGYWVPSENKFYPLDCFYGGNVTKDCPENILAKCKGMIEDWTGEPWISPPVKPNKPAPWAPSHPSSPVASHPGIKPGQVAPINIRPGGGARPHPRPPGGFIGYRPKPTLCVNAACSAAPGAAVSIGWDLMCGERDPGVIGGHLVSPTNLSPILMPVNIVGQGKRCLDNLQENQHQDCDKAIQSGGDAVTAYMQCQAMGGGMLGPIGAPNRPSGWSGFWWGLIGY